MMIKRRMKVDFTLVGFGLDTFLITVGGSFHAPAGLES
jgi:hypothetical protein